MFFLNLKGVEGGRRFPLIGIKKIEKLEVYRGLIRLTNLLWDTYLIANLDQYY